MGPGQERQTGEIEGGADIPEVVRAAFRSRVQDRIAGTLRGGLRRSDDPDAVLSDRAAGRTGYPLAGEDARETDFRGGAIRAAPSLAFAGESTIPMLHTCTSACQILAEIAFP